MSLYDYITLYKLSCQQTYSHSPYSLEEARYHVLNCPWRGPCGRTLQATSGARGSLSSKSQHKTITKNPKC